MTRLRTVNRRAKRRLAARPFGSLLRRWTRYARTPKRRSNLFGHRAHTIILDDLAHEATRDDRADAVAWAVRSMLPRPPRPSTDAEWAMVEVVVNTTALAMESLLDPAHPDHLAEVAYQWRDPAGVMWELIWTQGKWCRVWRAPAPQGWPKPVPTFCRWDICSYPRCRCAEKAGLEQTDPAW